jgi:hypothetical protein
MTPFFPLPSRLRLDRHRRNCAPPVRRCIPPRAGLCHATQQYHSRPRKPERRFPSKRGCHAHGAVRQQAAIGTRICRVPVPMESPEARTSDRPSIGNGGSAPRGATSRIRAASNIVQAPPLAFCAVQHVRHRRPKQRVPCTRPWSSTSLKATGFPTLPA